MVDIETHRVVDLLESRELDKVTAWLKSFPNIEVVSRDGSITYHSAIDAAHPQAIQVSDRFHLLKNLTDYCSAYIKRTLPPRVPISVDNIVDESNENAILESSQSEVSDKNRKLTLAEKYNKAIVLKKQGIMQTEICITLKLDCRVYQKLMKLNKGEVKKYFSTTLENKRESVLLDKLEKVKLVQDLHKKSYSNRAIAKMTGFSKVTISRYLDKGFSPIRKESSRNQIYILQPYKAEIEEKLLKGLAAIDIESSIREKGYIGSASTFRNFCANWKKTFAKIQQNSFFTDEENAMTEFILRKHILKLLYWPLNKVRDISIIYYNLLREQYPAFADIIDLLLEFKSILREQLIDKIDPWIHSARTLEIHEVNSFVNGLERDFDAVKNAIIYQYNNGLAEGSVNKLKVIKRIMYGRCSFELLKAKILRLEKIRNIN